MMVYTVAGCSFSYCYNIYSITESEAFMPRWLKGQDHMLLLIYFQVICLYGDAFGQKVPSKQMKMDNEQGKFNQPWTHRISWIYGAAYILCVLISADDDDKL